MKKKRSDPENSFVVSVCLFAQGLSDVRRTVQSLFSKAAVWSGHGHVCYGASCSLISVGPLSHRTGSLPRCRPGSSQQLEPCGTRTLLITLHFPLFLCSLNTAARLSAFSANSYTLLLYAPLPEPSLWLWHTPPRQLCLPSLRSGVRVFTVSPVLSESDLALRPSIWRPFPLPLLYSH